MAVRNQNHKAGPKMNIYHKSSLRQVPTRKILGTLMILSGVLLNKWALESILGPYGSIETTFRIFLILVEQGCLVGMGLWLVFRDKKKGTLPFLKGRKPFPPYTSAIVVLVCFAGISIGAYGSAYYLYELSLTRGPIQTPIYDVTELCEWLSQDDVPHIGVGVVKNTAAKLEKVANEPGTVDERVQLKLRLANYLLRHSQIAETIEHLESAFDLATTNQLPDEVFNKIRRALGVAHLRSGAIKHCIQMHNPESCLFPIRGKGVWENPQSAMKAIGYFDAYLKDQPDNPGVRWLLNIAHMAAGSYPSGLSPELLIPLSIIESIQEAPRFRNIAPTLGLDAFNLAGGAVMDDFDNDGFLDVITSTYHPCESMSYSHNNSDGTFSDWSEKSKLAEQLGGFNLVHADYNNDGLLDIAVLRGAWKGRGKYRKQRNSLLRQNSDGTFSDVTKDSGLGSSAYPSLAAAWGDYDNDGNLDLYIGNEWFPSELYRNNGDGTFTDVAEDAGVENNAHTKGVTWGDYDNDGDIDLYVSNVKGLNRLYRNNGNGTFTDVAKDLGVAIDESKSETFATWFWDVDNDGWLDLFVAGFNVKSGVREVAADYLELAATGERLRLFKNDRTGGFVDVTKEMKLHHVRLPMGANYGDIDNDGFLDFYLGTGAPGFDFLVPNRMYGNVNGKYFVDITTAANVGHLQKGHAIAFGDLDNDGDQDLYAQMGGWYPDDRFFNALFENPGTANHWITVKLIGVQTNRFGMGARIKVVVETKQGDRAIHRVVGSGGSFGSSSLQQEIGVGEANLIKTLEIFWPTSNTRQVFTNVAVDQFIEITEGDSDRRALSQKMIRFSH